MSKRVPEAIRLASAVERNTRVWLDEYCAAADELRRLHRANRKLIEVLHEAKTALAAALKVSAPDVFKTNNDVAEHQAVKRIDAAIAEATGRAT